MSTYQVWYKRGHCTDTADGLHGIGNLHHEVVTKLQWSLGTRLCLPTAKVVLALGNIPRSQACSASTFDWYYCEWLKLEAVGTRLQCSIQEHVTTPQSFLPLYIHSNSPWFVSWGLPHLSFWPGFLPYPKDWADPVHQGNQRSCVKMLSASS